MLLPLINCCRAITRNEIKYPKPEDFKPERFFNAHGELNDDTMSYVFGARCQFVSQFSSSIVHPYVDFMVVHRTGVGRYFADAPASLRYFRSSLLSTLKNVEMRKALISM